MFKLIKTNLRFITRLKNIYIKVENNSGLNDPLIKSEKSEYILDRPIHALIGALITCELHTMKFHARQKRIKLIDLNYRNLSTSLNFEGVIGKEGEQSRLHNVKGEAEVQAEGSEQEIKDLIKITKKCCPAHNMLSRAGVDIDVKWKIVN